MARFSKYSADGKAYNVQGGFVLGRIYDGIGPGQGPVDPRGPEYGMKWDPTTRGLREPTATEKEQFKSIDAENRAKLKQLAESDPDSEDVADSDESESDPESDPNSDEESLASWLNRQKKNMSRDWKILPRKNCNENSEYKVEGYAVDGHCRARPGHRDPNKSRKRKQKPKQRLNREEKLQAWRLNPREDCDQKTEYKVKGYVVSGHCRRKPNIEPESSETESLADEYANNESESSETESLADDYANVMPNSGTESQDVNDMISFMEHNSKPIPELSEKKSKPGPGQRSDPIVVSDDDGENETIPKHGRWLSENSMHSVRACLDISDCEYATHTQLITTIRTTQQRGGGNIIVNASDAGGSHWLLVMVDNTGIRVCDPLSGGGETKAAMKLIKGRFPNATYIAMAQQRDDGWSCGWRVLFWAFMRKADHSPPDEWYELVPMAVRLFHHQKNLIQPGDNRRTLSELIATARQMLSDLKNGGHARGNDAAVRRPTVTYEALPPQQDRHSRGIVGSRLDSDSASDNDVEEVVEELAGEVLPGTRITAGQMGMPDAPDPHDLFNFDSLVDDSDFFV